MLQRLSSICCCGRWFQTTTLCFRRHLNPLHKWQTLHGWSISPCLEFYLCKRRFCVLLRNVPLNSISWWLRTSTAVQLLPVRTPSYCTMQKWKRLHRNSAVLAMNSGTKTVVGKVASSNMNRYDLDCSEYSLTKGWLLE